MNAPAYRWADRRLYYGGKPAELTRQQLCLVEALIDARPRALSCPTLFQRLWAGREPESAEVVLRTQICWARRAIAATGCQENPIVTVRDRGYRWQGAVECEGPAPLLVPNAVASLLRRLLLTHPARSDADRCLAQIWA